MVVQTGNQARSSKFLAVNDLSRSEMCYLYRKVVVQLASGQARNLKTTGYYMPLLLP